MRKNIFAFRLFLLLIISLGVCAGDLSAQYAHSLYFMSGMSQRHQYNPAFVPEHGYVALPLVGNVEAGASGNVGVSNFIYNYNDEWVTFMHSSVDGQEFIKRLNPENYIKQNFSADLFSCGFFTKKNEFISFDLTVKENTYLNIPGDLFALAKLGMQTSDNYYDLKGMKASGISWAEASAGYSREFSDRLRIGAKAKLLVGLSAAKVQYDQFDVNLSQDRWSVQASGESQIMSHFLDYNVGNDGNFSYQDYLLNHHNKKPSGAGAAIDLGLSYRLTPDITVAASISDLGLIYWFPSSVKRGISESNVTYDGFSNIDYTQWQTQFWQLRDDAEKIMLFKKTPATKKYYDPLLATLRTSLEYRLWKTDHREISCGVLNNIYYGADNSDFEWVFALNAKLCSWMRLSSTYALLQKNSNRFGLAMNISTKWINFFIASDFVAPKLNKQFLPIDAFTFNIQTGISVPLFLNKPPYRYKYKDYPY